MTDKITGEVENLEQILERWLEYGMKIPVVHEYAVQLVPVCIKAIKEVNNYNLYEKIELPKGITISWLSSGETTNLCPAYMIVYRFQLTDWLKPDWNIKRDKPNYKEKHIEIPNSE